MTLNKTERWPANLIPITRALREDEPEIPAHIRQQARQEVSGDAELEWEPLAPYEELTGVLVRRTAMSLGGTAYVFDAQDENREGGRSAPVRVLLKRGGRILDSYLATVQGGERVWIRYCGELEAKPGQHPARDWRVITLQ